MPAIWLRRLQLREVVVVRHQTFSVNGHASTIRLIVCWWSHRMSVIWQGPICVECTAWAFTCPKTIQQRPWLTTEIETRLMDSRVSNNCVVDHRSRLPVLSPLRSCVYRCHIWPNWASGSKRRRWMIEHINIKRPVWMSFNDLKHLSCRLLLCGEVKVKPH